MNLPAFNLAPIIGPYSQPDDLITPATTQRHAYGRRFITWDGKYYKYCHSLGTLLAGFGAANIGASNISAAIPAATAVGDREILITIASGDGHAGDGIIAENELLGAQIVFGHGAESLANNRTIMANTAVPSGGGTCRVLLDMPCANVMTAASSWVEVCLNAYRYTSKGALEYNAFVCVPIKGCTTGYNYWGQTAGPCWICPGGGDATPGNTVNDRTAYFVGDGSVNFGTSLTIETGYQIAGFCIDQTSAALSAQPNVMLTLSY